MQAAVESEQAEVALDDIESIYQKHHSLVFRTAYRVTGDASDAEDVLQTVFLRLVKRDPGSVSVRGLEAFLYRSAVNAALDIVRSRSNKPGIPLENAPPIATAEPASAPERALASGEIREWLRHALTRLSPRAAEIFVMRFFEGKANPEIAETLDTTTSTVAVTLHRTRERLQREFQQEVGGWS